LRLDIKLPTVVTVALTAAVKAGLVLQCPVPVNAEDTSPTQATRVSVGLYMISFGNYDANKGTYSMDFYI